MFALSKAEGATVMLLGCPHLGEAGAHVFSTEYDDMLAPERQRQIAGCVERLSGFQPTKVAVEEPLCRQAELEADYDAYRQGHLALTASEEHQLGFRTAAALGHSRIFAIDAGHGGVAAGGLGEAVAFAEKDQPELYDRFIAARRKADETEQEAVPRTEVLEILRRHNDPAALRKDHQLYLLLSLLIAEGRYIGIDWVQSWYARNLRIFANLASIIDTPRDRVLVVYGAGHVPLLSQFILDSGLLQLVSSLDYLMP